MAICVLIADDHSAVREGLHMFLGRDPEFVVVGEGSNKSRAVFQALLSLSTLYAVSPDVLTNDTSFSVLLPFLPPA
jgi:DNA-binding NarL/FixJ family response regulator